MTQQFIQEIVRKQRSFFYKGNTLDIEFRIRSLKKLQASILEHQEQINAALKSDLGKSSFESYMCESGLVLQRKDRTHAPCTVSFQKLSEALSLWRGAGDESLELSISSHLRSSGRSTCSG